MDWFHQQREHNLMALILAWLVALWQLMQLTLLELALALEEPCLSPAVSLCLGELVPGQPVPMDWNQMPLPVVLAAELQAAPMGIGQVGAGIVLVVAVIQLGLYTLVEAPILSTLEFRHLQYK